MESFKKFKLQQTAVKLYVFGCGIGFTLYCGMLCLGMRHVLAEFVSMTFAHLVLFGSVWVFKLCWLAWAFAFYTYLIRCCIIVHRLGLFGEYIDLAHYVAFGIGVFLCICLFNKRNKCIKNEKQDDSQDAA